VALALYDGMRQDGIPPDAVCFNTCLTAAGESAGGAWVAARLRLQGESPLVRLLCCCLLLDALLQP